MAEAPPQLGNIPQTSELKIPTLSSTAPGENSGVNGNTSASDIKNTVTSNAQAAANTVANHPVTQNVKEAINQAPVTGVVKDQHAKTSAELSNLADSRKIPTQTTANDQPLTRYHSFFYTLLSWENPRVTAISYVTIVLTIFAFRYLPAIRWAFKALYLLLGATAAAEVAGKVVLSQGLASHIRPRRYYTIPREALEASLDDVEHLVNFFVIEFQRILFAENVLHTATACVASFLSYWLIKFTPLWGLSVIGVSFVYFVPLIYITNKEIIDEQISNASGVVNAQAAQLKDLAGHHTAQATETLKGYAGDYTAKAQEMISGTGAKSSSPPPAYSSQDFPRAPKDEPIKTEQVKAQPQAAF